MRHKFGNVTLTCIQPGLWEDDSGRWQIRRYESKLPGDVPEWTLYDRGLPVKKMDFFWSFQEDDFR